MKNNDQPGKFTSPAEIRIVRTLPGPIERIWEYLTDSEKRARWFASGPMEQRVGGKVRLVTRDNRRRRDGNTLVVEPYGRVSVLGHLGGSLRAGHRKA